MIKELEQISNKYKKIAEYAINLKQSNHILTSQIENLQQQLALLIEDKLRLEHKNNILEINLNQTKNGLKLLLDDIYLDENKQVQLDYVPHNINNDNNINNELVEIDFPPLFVLQQEEQQNNFEIEKISIDNNYENKAQDNKFIVQNTLITTNMPTNEIEKIEHN